MNNEDKILELLTKMDNRLGNLEQDVSGLKFGQAETNERLDTIQEDIEIIKEESTITRSMTNRLLKWAEKADRTAVNVGFDESE